MDFRDALVNVLFCYGSVSSDHYANVFSQQFHSNDNCEWISDGSLTSKSIFEWGGTFGEDTVIETYGLDHCSCVCGAYEDVCLFFDGSLGEFMEVLLKVSE